METYAQPGWGFLRNDPSPTSAIEGVRRAIAAIPADRLSNFGLAIYADWTTDPTEWRAYRDGWVRPNGA